jgi:hypothetical protein
VSSSVGLMHVEAWRLERILGPGRALTFGPWSIFTVLRLTAFLWLSDSSSSFNCSTVILRGTVRAIVAVMLVAVGVSWARFFQTPTYEASAPVMVAQKQGNQRGGEIQPLPTPASAREEGKNSRIAYTDWDGGKDYEIYTINPDGSGKTQLTHNDTNDIDPAYSPDGEKIAYVGLDGEIHTINVGGGGKSRDTNNDTFLYRLC